MKVGDKAIARSQRHASPNGEQFDVEPGKVYTINVVDGESVGFEGMGVTKFSASRFDLYQAGMLVDDQVYVNGLVKKANDGRKALEELFKLVPNQIEIVNYDHSFNPKAQRGQWGPLKSAYRLEYRVKPRHKSFPLTKIGQWSIQTTVDCNKIHEDDIQIGCQVFSSRLLKSCLQDMSNNYHETRYNVGNDYYFFTATRIGVVFKKNADAVDAGHLLAWDEAQRLFEALSEFLK